MLHADRKNGFTLVELLIVIVIVGILTAIAIPRFGNIANGAKEAEVKPLLKQVYTLELAYKAAYDSYAQISDLQGWTFPNPEYYGGFIIATSTGFTVVAAAKSQYEDLRDFYINDQGVLGIYNP